jgi:hypothetical protein
MDKHVIFRIVLIILAAFVLFALVNYYNSKQKVASAEKFYQDTLQANIPLSSQQQQTAKTSLLTQPDLNISGNTVGPAEESQSSSYRPIDFESQKVPGDCFPKDRLSADDLLPKDAANAKWAQVNPAGQGDVRDQNFLTAGALVGIDTVGSTLRNASWDIRGDSVPNPRSVWPIHNSTIEPNLMQRKLEMSGDCQQ